MIIVAVVFVVAAALAYNYKDVLLPLLLAPLHGQKLIYLNVAGAFNFSLLVSIYAGLIVALPLLIQQLYAFLRPALPERARKKSSVIIISSLLLLSAGVAFGYAVAIPGALTFLNSFADQWVNSSLTADSYLSFVIGYTMGIGLVFQVPLLLLLIHSIKPLTPGGLMKSEKWVVLLAFIAAAIITPTPDPVNQTIIALPVIVVYQLGVIAVLVNIGQSRRIEKKAQKFADKESLLEQTVSSLQPFEVDVAPNPSPSPAPATPLTTQPLSAAKLSVQSKLAPANQQPVAQKPSVLANSFNTPTAQPVARPQHLNPAQPRMANPVRPVRPAHSPRTIDGFVRVNQRPQVSQRPIATQPQAANKKLSLGPSLYSDVIVVPRRATSY